MKKILFALPLLFAISCGNTEEKTSGTSPAKTGTGADAHAGHNHDGHGHDGHDHGTGASAAVSVKTHDPVCKMERDEKWTFESVYEGDTVKFCNPVCKTKFDKDPASFVAKK